MRPRVGRLALNAAEMHPDTPRPYTRSRPTCNLSDQILELGIESRRGLKQRRIFAGHHQRRWQVIDDRHALAILVLYQKQLDGREQRSLKVMSYHGNCDDRIAKNPPRKLPLNTVQPKPLVVIEFGEQHESALFCL